MLNAAVQNKGFSQAGLLSNVMVQDSAKYSAQFLTNPNGKSAESLADYLSKPDIENLIKPNVHKCAVSGGQGFNYVTTRAAEGFSEVITRAEGFSDITTRADKGLSGVTTRADEDLFGVISRDGKVFLTSLRESGSLCNSTRPCARTYRVLAPSENFSSNLRLCLKVFLKSLREGRGFATSTRTRGEFLESIKKGDEFRSTIKKGLQPSVAMGYGNDAPAKSGAGIGVPVLIRATHDAPSVFFCVDGLAHTFFSSAVIIRAAHEIMVGWMGASSEAPVTLIAGYANPVQSTTSLIGVFGGGFKTLIKEAASWLLPSPKLHQNLSGLSPQFAAIVRQSKLLSTISLLFQNKKPAAFLRVTMFASLLVASSYRGCHMLKTYDLTVDPIERTAQLISLAELMRDVLESDSDSRDKYLAALVGLFDISIRDLHCLLEGNQLPEVVA